MLSFSGLGVSEGELSSLSVSKLVIESVIEWKRKKFMPESVIPGKLNEGSVTMLLDGKDSG